VTTALSREIQPGPLADTALDVLLFMLLVNVYGRSSGVVVAAAAVA
jgi:hypothetical protein